MKDIDQAFITDLKLISKTDAAVCSLSFLNSFFLILFVIMHDSFIAHYLPTEFFFSPFCLEPARKSYRRGGRNWVGEQHLNTAAWLPLVLAFPAWASLIQPRCHPSLHPLPARGLTGWLLQETDCRQDVGIFPSEWTLTHWIEQEAFRNASFVRIACLF